MHIHTTLQKWDHVCVCTCVYVRVYSPPSPPPPVPPLTLIHEGGDVKEMEGIWWSLFICSISSLLSERNKSHVGGAAWGLRVHPSSFLLTSSLYSSICPSPIPSLHLIRIPLRRGNILLMLIVQASQMLMNQRPTQWDQTGTTSERCLSQQHVQDTCTVPLRVTMRP